jgi:hypothetical protein
MFNFSLLTDNTTVRPPFPSILSNPFLEGHEDLLPKDISKRQNSESDYHSVPSDFGELNTECKFNFFFFFAHIS